MVAAPWRRFVSAARWNGHAPQVTTGLASVGAAQLPVTELDGWDHGEGEDRHREGDAADQSSAR
jgi:hypothetical protein